MKLLVKHSFFIGTLLLLNPFNSFPQSRAWKEAKKTNTLEAYKEFLYQNPISKYHFEALLKIDTLEWNNAKNVNINKSYNDYLKNHENGQFAETAKQKVDSFTWEFAKKQKSIYGYQYYIYLLPNGKFAITAMSKLDSIEWEEALEKNTIESYYNYLQKYKSGEHKFGAQIKFSELLKNSTPLFQSELELLLRQIESASSPFNLDNIKRLVRESGGRHSGKCAPRPNSGRYTYLKFDRNNMEISIVNTGNIPIDVMFSESALPEYLEPIQKAVLKGFDNDPSNLIGFHEVWIIESDSKKSIEFHYVYINNKWWYLGNSH